MVAVAAKPAPELTTITADDERDLMLAGFLVFADEPKAAARESLAQLAALGIEVKIATGDNPRVAEKVCAEMGLASKGTVTGSQLESLDEDEFAAAAQNHTIFARITPEQKAHLIKSARRTGRSVGFLGDGVNDALALHAADVGISVDSATDVAKDAADVVLLEKDLGVLAAGVAEGRRIFANTMKYVLMGTSSNFGNMFSAAAASALLPFLPMLPSQILLNNLLYDTSQLAIPTDRVDEEQLHAPAHWNVAFIRRFMLTFGPISSLFDFLTFGLMLGVLHAGAVQFRTGWFVESLATQTSRGRSSPIFCRVDAASARSSAKNRMMSIRLSLMCVTTALAVATSHADAQRAATQRPATPRPDTAARVPLDRAFRTPPDEAKPRVWWHWMNGNVTREGITADLEWMERVGIGGMQMFDGSLGTPQFVENRLVWMTPAWKAAFRHAAAEARAASASR